MAKISGAEFKRFYSDEAHWDDAWYDEGMLKVNDVEVDDVDITTLADADAVEIVSGYVIGKDGSAKGTLKSFYATWAKAQTHTAIALDVPKANVAALIEAAKQLGATPSSGG
jgi:hypothetical protein